MGARKTTHLYLTRHGETEWNVAHRMQGRQDSPLTALGLRQAAWLSEALAEVALDAIYASPSPRALRTAEILRRERPIPVQPEARLYEISLGAWEGLRGEDIVARDPERHHVFWHDPPAYQPVGGGETFEEVARRVLSCVEELLAAHHGQRLLLVTHTVALKVIMSAYEGRPLSRLWDPPFIHPTSLCHIALDGTGHTILKHGDVSHFPEPL
ncbi:MAG TPA: histidine phosphatase family protein [Ktedonobacterales bacterium]